MSEVVKDLQNDDVSVNVHDDEGNDVDADEARHITDTGERTDHVVHTDVETNILDAICQKLLDSKNGKKWQSKNLNVTTLFRNFLHTANNIFSNFTVAELHIIAEVYASYTGGKMKIKKVTRKLTL